jgi:hypothetical protein
MIKYVYFVPYLEKKLLLISSIIKHSLDFYINYSINRCFVVDKNNKTTIVMGVEKQGLFQMIEVKNARLV